MDPLLQGILSSRDPTQLIREMRPEWALGGERVGGYQSVNDPLVGARRFAAPTPAVAKANLAKTFLEEATPDFLSKVAKYLYEMGANTTRARLAGEADPLGPLNLIPFGGPAVGAAGMIAGRKGAATAGKGAWFEAAVRKAENMEAKGVPSQEIWRKLGLEREKGGQWTWEIPDDAARLSPAAQDVLGGGKSLTGMPMREVYEHPELYKAYPELGGLPANVGRGARGGSYKPTIAPEGGEISAIARDPAMMLRVLTHEGQHGVQEIERMPMGGSPATVTQGEVALARSRPLSVEDLRDPAKTAYMRRAGEAQARNAEARLVDTELRRFAPGVTEDVPRLLQTVRYLQETSPQLAVKEKGGMWHPEAVERLAAPLKDKIARAGGPVDSYATIRQEHDAANAWSQRAIRNYLNKHAGTASDPLKDVEIPFGEGVKRWEEITDKAIGNLPAKKFTQADPVSGHREMFDEAFKAPAEEPIYGLRGNSVWRSATVKETDALQSYLSHVGDYLRQNVAPEKLQQYDLVRAVKETAANDARVAREMEKSAVASMKDMPVYKDYSTQNPGSLPGMKWMELKMPEKLPESQWKLVRHAKKGEEVPTGHAGDFVALDYEGKPIKNSYTNTIATGPTPESAYLSGQLAQEGNQMGHCVGGYCEGVASGESRIFSLRDAKGRSHVTVEVAPHLKKDYRGKGLEHDVSDILQIKGKQNRAPVAEYLPYVQDFVKSGKWGEVGDLQNTGLVKSPTGEYVPERYLRD